MERPNLESLRSMPLERLVSDALGELERLGYSRRSRNRYRAVWQHLIEYSDQNKLGDEFSGDLAVRFLDGHRSVRIWKRRVEGGASISCGA